MKMFQRSFLVAICFFIAAGAMAQSRFTFGVKGGVNLSESSGSLSSDNKVGFNAGLTIDYQLTPNWYVMSGLELTTKGTKSSIGYYSYSSGYGYGNGYGYGSGYGELTPVSGYSFSYMESTKNLMYLQVPIHLGYKVDLGGSTKLVFSAGPYVAYGIGGKTKGHSFYNEGNPAAYLQQYTIDQKSFDDVNRRFDLGLGATMGVEFGKFAVNIGYDWGLNNVMKNMDSKNKNGFLSVGYKF